MHALKRILVPLDGSAVSATVIPLAEALARDYGAELVLFRAVRLGGFEALDPEADIDVTAEAEGYLSQIAGELQADRGLPGVRWSVAHGRAGRAIAEAAATNGVDLVAMTTHGRGGLARLLFGSVAEAVIRQAPAPVLLVRGQPSWTRGGIGQILVPLDGSELSEGVLPIVERLAGPLDYTIHLLHVIESPPPYTATEASTRLEEIMQERKAMADDYLLKIGGRLEAKGLRERQAVRTGGVLQVIQDYAEEEGVGLIAMTTHGRTGFERALLGSVAERVARSVPVPVLLWKGRPG